MSEPLLTVACGDYDRVAPLRDGRVRPEGVQLNMVRLEPEESFWRMARHEEFDVAEMSLASYFMMRAGGDHRFVAIPVFLARSFRHASIYVREGSKIQEPADLNGRSIGVPEYQMTAAVWARGLLSDDFGVDLSSIEWVTCSADTTASAARQRLHLPDHIHTRALGSYAELMKAFAAGELEALIAPRVPATYQLDGQGAIRRLFPDHHAKARDYYLRTRIFPIMHLMVVRANRHSQFPWLAQSIYKAFAEAKRLTLAGVVAEPTPRYTMPFLPAAIEEQVSVFGEDPWPYGLPANAGALETFGRYLVEQGLIETIPTVNDLFAESTEIQSEDGHYPALWSID
jgi:4,5-dihydroxyphthalate decarboxylase